MGFSQSLSARCLLALAFASLGACSSEPKDEPANEGAGRAALPPLMVDNAAGTTGGSAGMVTTPSAVAGSGASGASASSAGTGGVSAGTGGGAGSMASAAGSSAAGAGASAQPDAGPPAEEDPFAGLLGPIEVSCEGLLCLESADCASLYPEENATCKFTGCVDFMCM